MKTIVTHISPDLDAIAACWLIKKFLPHWQHAEIFFVPAGKTFNDLSPDSEPNVVHVDTGMGKFDHHQSDNDTSATKLVFQYLLNDSRIKNKEIPALERIVEFVNLTDNFEEVHFPEPTSDIYDFALHQQIRGLKAKLQSDTKLVEFVFTLLDAELLFFKNKVNAEEEIKKGLVLKTRFGKTLFLESGNSEAIKLGLKSNFALVVQREPSHGYIRIKSLPLKKLNLTNLYIKLLKLDPKATWYLHPSNNIILNGSYSNPKTKPSTLTLKKIIALVSEM